MLEFSGNGGAMKGNDQIKSMVSAKFDAELQARLAGTRKYSTFDLSDLEDHVKLAVLKDPALSDVQTVVLFADEKRRLMEDFRAFRRNRNDWIALVAALAVAGACPFVIGISWIVNVLILSPQLAMLAIKTRRRY